MAQFGRPSADTNNPDSYTDEGGGSTNIYTHIDEVTEADSDYIRTVATPTSDVFVTKLSSVTDPVSSTGHIMRMATATDLASQEAIDFTQQLRQAYVSEGTQGTLIASQSRTGVTSTSFTVSTYTLSAGEADSITDYANLYYRFLINKP